MKRSYFLLGIIVLAVMAASSLAWAATIFPGGLAVERISQAPWIFVGQIIESEIVNDSHTPPHANRSWRFRNTRFKVLRKAKGSFGKGGEVTLKECPSNTEMSQRLGDEPTLCLLANRPPNYQVGDTFLIFTGPGHPRQNQYQAATHIRVSRVPIRRELVLKSPDGQKKSERDIAHSKIPYAPSGWMVDLSNRSLWIRDNAPSGIPHGPKGEGLVKQYGLTSDEAAIVSSHGSVDLDLFLGIVGKMKQ